MRRFMLMALLLVSFFGLTNCMGCSSEELIKKALYDEAQRQLAEVHLKLSASAQEVVQLKKRVSELETENQSLKNKLSSRTENAKDLFGK